MRRALLLPLLALLLAGPWAQAAGTERGPRRAGATAMTDDADSARVIVKYRSGSSLARDGAGAPRQAARLGRQMGLALSDGHVLGRRMQSLHARGLSSAALAASLAADPEVEWAVPVRRKTFNAALPNDPLYLDGQTTFTPAAGQWYLRAPDATLLSATNAFGAWGITQGTASITVAVVDTGVRFDHPDFFKADGSSKLWPGYDFVRNSISSDGDGVDSDASDPGDWSTSTDSCGAASSSWHGTQVAGLIGAATDNAVGMASLGRNVMVLPVRVLGKCGGYDDDIIAGLRWAAGLSNTTACNAAGGAATRAVDCNPHPAQVINLSLGSSGTCSTAYRDVVAELTAAGVSVVVAAGNDAGHAVNEPANCPGVIAVAGVRHAGTKVGYSNLGPEVALAAPAGNCVNLTGTCLYPLLTTVNAGTTTPGVNTYSDGSHYSVGTSFAAPMVAGTVGLMLSVDPHLSPAQVKTALQATARPFPTVGAQANGTTACVAPSALDQIECYCTSTTCGAGLLDAGAAVAKVGGTSIAPKAVFAASNDSPTVGTTVVLDGGPSSASVVGYEWSLTSGGSLASFSGSTASRYANLVTSGAGSVVVSLRVQDAAGAAHSISKTLSPTLAPSAALVVSTPNATVGASIALNGTASPASPGRTITAYQWSKAGTTPAHFTTATNASLATLVADGVGNDLSVTLRVTDSAGASASTSQSIAVAAAPTASFTVSNASPAAGTSVTLDGRASAAAPGHSINAYQWMIVSGASLGAFAGATNSSTATLSTSAPGTMVVRLTVTDDAGASAAADLTITVAVPSVVVVSSSGGGGALGACGLLGLALAVLALSRLPARRPG